MDAETKTTYRIEIKLSVDEALDVSEFLEEIDRVKGIEGNSTVMELLNGLQTKLSEIEKNKSIT